jgi:hypothetical protein
MMGAEFCIMTLDWLVKGKSESMKKGFERTCKEIDGRIKKIKRFPSTEQMMDVNSTWSPDPDGPPLAMLDEHNKPLTLKMYKNHLHFLVANLRDRWDGRDSTVIKVAGHFILITGGMTWGDSPGETFDILVKLSYAGVL